MRALGLLAITLCLAFADARAAPAACAQDYVGGAEPQATASIVVREICFEAFAVGHSGATRTPLWSAERLTAAEVDAAHTLARRDAFHAERQLPPSERAVLADYVRSGFDRGHLAPSGDMPTSSAQAQSFSLANIVPQRAVLNRGLWEEIEETTRDLAEADGEVYVVTGPIFDRGGATAALRGRVSVPSAMYKAIYTPRLGAAAYIAPNSAGGSYRIISIADLRRLIGFDVFPSLPDTIKQRAAALPQPGGARVAANDNGRITAAAFAR